VGAVRAGGRAAAGASRPGGLTASAVHLLLTDRLSCPRCGPEFGLILLADVMEDRKVVDGSLGCPNCRDAFVIRGGFGDLRAPPRPPLAAGLAGAPTPPDPLEVERLVALLGVVRGPGTLAFVGEPARHAASVAEMISDIHAVAVDADLAAWPDAPGVSRLVSAPGLPFFSRALRGVVVDGRLGAALIADAARVTAPMSRVVVVHAAPEATSTLEAAGLKILAHEAETVVAARA
jgi:uncharacterized protein YbaR (Trm112 family)